RVRGRRAGVLLRRRRARRQAASEPPGARRARARRPTRPFLSRANVAWGRESVLGVRSLLTGRSAAWKRTCLGRRWSAVRIGSPRPNGTPAPVAQVDRATFLLRRFGGATGDPAPWQEREGSDGRASETAAHERRGRTEGRGSGPPLRRRDA